MAKPISFGKYNKLYKYIWIYVIIRTVDDYIFTEDFPSQIKPNIFNSSNFPPIILVQIFFNYLGAFLFSIFLYFYQKSPLSGEEKKDEITIKSESLHKQYNLIYEISGPNIRVKTIIFTIILSIISIESINVFSAVGFWSLFFWVFDLFLVANVFLIKNVL